MIDHISTYTTDFARTKAFYDAVLPDLGYELQAEFVSRDDDLGARRICAYGPPGKGEYWIIEVAQPATPRHVAFLARSRECVDRFHAAGLEAGAADNGPPGPRPGYHQHYYGAFLIDPDGNNVEAVCHKPA